MPYGVGAKSNQALKEQLTQATLEKWKAATQEVCAATYAPYRQWTIYPQRVVGSDDRLNRVLLEELKNLVQQRDRSFLALSNSYLPNRK